MKKLSRYHRLVTEIHTEMRARKKRDRLRSLSILRHRNFSIAIFDNNIKTYLKKIDGVARDIGITTYMEKDMHIANEYRVSVPQSTKFIDHLINLYGNITVEEFNAIQKEKRKKGTSEVRESQKINKNADFHGGDGNSQECDNESETQSDLAESTESNNNKGGAKSKEKSSKEVSETGSREPEDSNCSECKTVDGSAASADNRHGMRRNKKESASKSKENSEYDTESKGTQDRQSGDVDSVTEKEGSPELMDEASIEDISSLNCDSDDFSKSENRPLETGLCGTETVAQKDAWEENKSKSSQSLSNREKWGGINASLQEEYNRSISLIKGGKKFNNILFKIYKMLDNSGIEDSLRVSGKKLLKEIHTKRYNLNRSKKQELGQGVFLLLPDLSGSCSACCKDTLAACYALQRANPNNFIVIPHSNGYVGDSENFHSGESSIVDIFKRIEKKHTISGAIAFGDWDAQEQYEYLINKANGFIWLDSYCCNYCKAQPAYPDIMRGRPNTALYNGVNSLDSANMALNNFLKRKG